MKNLKNILSVALLATAVAFTSCSKDDDTGGEDKDPVVLTNTVLKFSGSVDSGEVDDNGDPIFKGQRVSYSSDVAQDFVNGATDYTIEAWVKPNVDTVPHNAIIVKRYYQYAMTFYNKESGLGADMVYLTLYHYVDNGEGGFDAVNTYINSKPGVIKNGEWNHIAFVSNSTDNTFKVYVNGEDATAEEKNYESKSLEATPTNGDTKYAPNLYLAYASGKYTTVEMDEVRVIAEAIAPSDLRLDMFADDYETNDKTSVLFHFEQPEGTTFIVNDVATGEVMIQLEDNDTKTPPTFVEYEK